MRHLSALSLAIAISAPAAPAETLTILHTNDFHSRIEPINKYDSTCGAEEGAAGQCFGGSARLATAIREARAGSNNAILVDGGDQFQGSLFYTYYKGKAAAEMMNALGYEAMTVGNHEFDDGPEVLRGFMDAVEFPVLMANADVSAEPALAEAIRPSVVVERGGEKIGLIGLTPEDTAEMSSPGKNIRFGDPVAAVRGEVERLAGRGVERIIVLSHSGYFEDQRIAAAVDGIDVIVGGHSHTLLANGIEDAAGPYPTWVGTPDGGRTAIVQAGAYGRYLGRIDVSFDENGVVTGATGEPVPMAGAVAEDETLKRRIAELAGPLDEVRKRVVGEALAPIDGSRESCRARECEMGDLVAGAMLERVRGQGISIAITNGGGLRASIDGGPITMGEVLTVLPFQNTLSTFRLSGADVVAALENGVSQVEEGAGRFPQVAGLRYGFDPAAPAGSRIGRVEVQADGGWRPIETERLYGVVSNNFLRGGGDGYVIFAEKAQDAYDYGPDVADVVAEYLTASGPFRPATDARVVAE
jgi:5'-nucleotidase